MANFTINIDGLSFFRPPGRNICSQIFRSQLNGRGIKNHHIPPAFLEDLDVKFGLRKIPAIIRDVERNLQNSKLDKTFVTTALKDLHGLQNSDNIITRGLREGSREKSSESWSWNYGASYLINLFGGVEVILRLLFSEDVRPNRDLNNQFTVPRSSSMAQLELRSICLDILHEVCLNVETVAANISKKDKLIEYLFLMMEDKKTFSCASAVLEDLLASNRKIVELSKIGNLHTLIVSLRDNNFASFCRILSVVIADIDFSEDRNTLLAQDKEEKVRAVEKSIADQNQALLLSFPEFLSRMVKLAGKNLTGQPFPSHQSRASFENAIWNNSDVNVAAFLDELASLDSQNDGSNSPGSPGLFGDGSLASIIPRRLKYIHEVMYKVEILYVLTLFLNGKFKAEVQFRLGDLKLIPALCDLFDKVGWNLSSDRFPTHNHAEAEDCDCTPESALKIQFLRFVHSFCDHSEKKHLLLSNREVEEIYKICEKNSFEIPAGLERSKGRFRCHGEKGLLTKIVDVLKRTAPNNALRFWLSRAVEGFLRGRVSPPDQYLLLRRDLVEHLLEHILNPETKSKEILQSSFDLLGELMKFNENAFQRFNNFVITDKQFETFVSTMTSNVVDSNMFIRCIVLSLERFSSSPKLTSCRLRDLIRKWEHKMYLMYKLITTISVDNLTQENVSCLNTTLIFLMFAHNHGHLGQYLQAFSSEEEAQRHPGLILTNLRDLLEFWRVHYLQRGKDRSQLEQSSCIGFEHWQKLVDVLLHRDSTNPTSILHYLKPWQQQAPSRVRAEFLQRDG